MRIRKANENDYKTIMQIWDTSVRATHTFITEKDFLYYKKIIPTNFLPKLSIYILEDEQPRGFIGVLGENVEMLFIDAKSRGCGYGKYLLHFALENLKITKLDVNEQNIQAIEFYRKIGFEQTGRSEKDSMGKNYPILHLKYCRKCK